MYNSQIHPDAKLVVVRFNGSTQYEDFVSWIDELRQDPGFSRDLDGIMDLRRAVYAQKRTEKVEHFARYMMELNLTQGRWAVVATGAIETAFSLIYGTLVIGQHSIDIFSTMDAAGRFLNRDLAKVDPDLVD